MAESTFTPFGGMNVRPGHRSGLVQKANYLNW